jgi:hypothetical protein
LAILLAAASSRRLAAAKPETALLMASLIGTNWARVIHKASHFAGDFTRVLAAF